MYEEINKSMDKYAISDVIEMMDEGQFAANFAGTLGTLQLLQSTLAALNLKTNKETVREGEIVFPPMLNKDGKSFTYTDAYKDSPTAFLKEVARLDPPVTSANCLVKDTTTISAKYCFG